MISLIKNKTLHPVMDLLKQGITPEMLALSIVLGFVIGIIPFMGISTGICAFLALIFRLNIVAIQIANYIAYPLQLILFIPFIKAGESVFGYTSTSLSINEIVQLFQESFIEAAKILWLANLQGLLIWLIIAVPASFIFYSLSLQILRKLNPEPVSAD
jgi:hypothetical protein